MIHNKKMLSICLIVLVLQSAAGCSGGMSGKPKSATYTPLPPTPIPDMEVLFLGERLMFFWYWPQTDYQKFSHAADADKYVSVEHIFPGGIDVNTENLGTFWENSAVHDLLEEGFDVIVIQEAQERCYEEKDLFHEDLRKFHEKASSAGSEIVLFMNWPDEDRWEDLDEIVRSYEEISSVLDIKVAPVSLAWDKSLASHPELDLFFDNGELSSKYGDYLAMCVVYATITGKSPVGVSYTGFLTEEEAATLQEIAWETVQEYQQ